MMDEVPDILSGHRQRLDGWTPARLADFLRTLAETGCVRDAARVVGLSAQAAYRLRAKSPAFAARWDRAMAEAHEGLVAIAYKRAVEGKETIIIRKGEEVERRISPSDAMLSLLMKRGDLSGERASAAAISYEEHVEGWHFDAQGQKIKGPSQAQKAETRRIANKVRAKLLRSHAFLSAQSLAADEPCFHCGGPMTETLRENWQRGIDETYASADAYEREDIPSASDGEMPNIAHEIRTF